MSVFIVLNVLCLIALYFLLCNTAIIKTNRQDDGRYLYDKVYIIGDIIKPNNMNDFAKGVVLLLLSVVPITWMICMSVSIFILFGYLNGRVEIFGKNKMF
jgi:hypothetical protein